MSIFPWLTQTSSHRAKLASNIFFDRSISSNFGSSAVTGPVCLNRFLVSHFRPIRVMWGQPFIADSSAGPLDIGARLRLAKQYIFEVASHKQRSTARLPSLDAWGRYRTEWPRLASPANDLRDSANYALGGRRKVDLNAKRPEVQCFDRIELSKAAPVGKLVVPQVQRPNLVHVGCYRAPRGHVRRDSSEFHFLHCYLPCLALYTRRGIAARPPSDWNQPALQPPTNFKGGKQ